MGVSPITQFVSFQAPFHLAIVLLTACILCRYILGHRTTIEQCIDRIRNPDEAGKFINGNPAIPDDVAREFQNAVNDAIADASSCVPMGAVIVSMYNAHHRQIRRMQFHHVEQHRCMMQRTVSLAWGTEDDGKGIVVQAPPLPASNFREASYHHMCWVSFCTLTLLRSAN